MKGIKSTIMTGAITLASILPIKSNALDGFLKYVQPIDDPSGSYVEVDAFYGLPGKVNGFTWAYAYRGGEGYFGETNLEREVTNGFNVNSQMQHCNTPINRAGFGISRQVPLPTDKVFLKASALPIFFDETGIQKNSADLGYFISAELPHGFRIESFGDWNLADKNGPQWGYGEISVSREAVKGVRLMYDPSLLNKGNAVPEVQHRAGITLNF